MALASKELPPICSRGRHQWVGEITPHACGNSSGDQVLEETIVLVGEKSEKGSVCNRCFQKRGKPPGERDENLVHIFLSLKSLEKKHR